MTAWASFYSRVLPYVPGCPAPQVDLALVDAAREFCKRTRAWVNQAAAQEGTGSQQAYNFVFPSESELVEVLRATVAGEDMAILSSREMPADWQEASPETDTLVDAIVVNNLNTAFRVYPPPASGDDIVIYQALQPTLAATGVGDIIYTEYAEAMASGAKYRLMAMPNKPWTNMDFAPFERAAFEDGIRMAANRVFRQGQRRTKLSVL